MRDNRSRSGVENDVFLFPFLASLKDRATSSAAFLACSKDRGLSIITCLSSAKDLLLVIFVFVFKVISILR